MFFQRPTIEHFAVFHADQSPLEDVRAFVQAALLETTLDKKSIAGLMLAVEEAVTNIIRHGYLFGPGRIRVRVRHSRQWATIFVSDTGRAYSIDTPDSPDAAKLAETARRGGLGQFLMRKVTDRLEYKRIGDENTLTLAKRLPTSGSGPVSSHSLRRRVSVIGSVAVASFVLLSAWLMQSGAARRLTADFHLHWQKFGRAAAAAASQHILNNRSDVEFDQLVVDLRDAHPGVRNLVILAHDPILGSAARIVRAHSESPELVHQLYNPPSREANRSVVGEGEAPAEPNGGKSTDALGSAGASPSREANRSVVREGEAPAEPNRSIVREGEAPAEPNRVLVESGGIRSYHFEADVRVDGRSLGAVVWDVPEFVLTGEIASEQRSILLWAVFVLTGGLAFVLIGSSWIARPLAHLTEALRLARERGAESPASVAGPEEIQEVVAAFNEATASVARAQRDLAERDQARREIEASEQVQRALLPQTLPELPGYELAATCRMARHVGGDYYDLIALDPRHVLFIIADVAGKGLPAALIMTALRTATRLLAPHNPAPRELLGALHRYMRENHPSGPFVTACALVIDTEGHKAEIASAGHTPAIWTRAPGGESRRVNPRGRPLGVALESEGFADQIESEQLALSPGDQIALFTDGLVDTRTGRGETIGIRRLEDYLTTTITKPAAEIPHGIIAEAESFAGTAQGLVDDLTFLVIRRTSASPEPPSVGRVRNHVEVQVD